VDYRIEEGPATRALIIRVHEKDTGPITALRPELATAARATAISRARELSRTWVNRFGAEWKLETQVGQNSYAFTEFYQPLTRYGYYFIAPYASAASRIKASTAATIASPNTWCAERADST